MNERPSAAFFYEQRFRARNFAKSINSLYPVWTATRNIRPEYVGPSKFAIVEIRKIG